MGNLFSWTLATVSRCSVRAVKCESVAMHRWFFVVVLYGACVAIGTTANNDSLARATNLRDPSCQKLYTFGKLDYEKLKKSRA